MKPSNILVAESEGKPFPKIIDFGLAKALGGQQLTEMSLFTEQGALPFDTEDLRMAAQVVAILSIRKRICFRLSDIKKFSELRDEADRLWPAYPSRVKAMEGWLGDARNLAGNLDEHEKTLLELRKEAVTESQSIDEGQTDGEESETLAEWKFADTQTQWRHDVLSELVSGLLEFVDPDPQVGLIADVGERLTFARTVREETIEKYDVEWEEAIASIRDDCPQYNGFEIKPQVGLVPIGRDPDSGLWEFAHLQTGEIPDRDENGELLLTEEMGIVFVLIPGGTFRMGAQGKDPKAPNFDRDGNSDEGPVHEVTLDQFFLSKYEMTQAQWERFVGKNPSRYGTNDYATDWDRTPARKRKRLMGLHPVEQVSWDNCLDVMGHLDFVLPSEAQWEYAARAGTSTVFWTGDEVTSLSGAANLADEYAKANGGNTWTCEKELDDGYTVHSPIGRFRANRFGLHDIHGNIWEWCGDWYGPYATQLHGFRVDAVRPREFDSVGPVY